MSILTQIERDSLLRVRVYKGSESFYKMRIEEEAQVIRAGKLQRIKTKAPRVLNLHIQKLGICNPHILFPYPLELCSQNKKSLFIGVHKK